MRKFLILLTIMITSVVSFALTANAQVSVSPTPSVEDVKQIRKVVAENDSLKTENVELRKQCDEWKQSASNWQKLAEAEKDRADKVQASVISNLEQALKNKEFAVNLQREQINSDKHYIDSLETKVKSLQKSRWKVGAISFVAGNATGSYLGYKIGRLNR